MTVTTSVINNIATVQMNRPEKHNAFDDEVIAELQAAFDEVAGQEDVKAMVLSSEGKNFSAGADFNWMQRMAEYSYEENVRDAGKLAAMLQTLNDLPMPTIARVQGAAFGGAVGLVSCCDMAVAADRSSFCLSEVKIGLIPATVSPYVIAAIGERAARRYFVTAERFSAEAALALNLVSMVVTEDELDSAIQGLINSVLQNGPQAVRKAKSLIKSVSGKDISPELIQHTCEQIAEIRVSEEGQDGLSAFLNKRSPSWQTEE